MANTELTVSDLFAKIGALVVRNEALEQALIQKTAEYDQLRAHYAEASGQDFADVPEPPESGPRVIDSADSE